MCERALQTKNKALQYLQFLTHPYINCLRSIEENYGTINMNAQIFN